MLTSDNFNEWTACEVNGHKYEDVHCDIDNYGTACDCGSVIARRCVDCGDEY